VGRLGGESQHGVSERDIPGARRRRGKSGKAGESCSLRPGHLARGPPAGGNERAGEGWGREGGRMGGGYAVGRREETESTSRPRGQQRWGRKRGGSPGGERA